MSRPRIQQPPPRLTLLYQLFRATQLSRSLVSRALAGTGWRGDDYAVASLLRAGGPSTLTAMAAGLGMPLTTMAGFLRRLEADGIIARHRDPRDRRSQIVELSEDGNRALDEAIPRFTAAYRAFLAELATDQEEVFAALEQLQAALEMANRRLREPAGQPGATRLSRR
jgi:DNA-binding MarR family transcriptional regulator